MHNPLDAARHALAAVDPTMPGEQREKLARKIATECSPEQIATLVNEIVTCERNLQREIAELEARLYVAARANGMRRKIDMRRKTPT